MSNQPNTLDVTTTPEGGKVMETLDGYKLNEGDECWVSVQDPSGEHQLSSSLRRALYLDNNAKYHGWDFTVYGLHVPDIEVEIVAVYKYQASIQEESER